MTPTSRTLTALALMAVLTAGCSAQFAPDAPRAREADEAGVESCEFLESVADYGKPMGDYQRGLTRAKDKVAARAAALGGTHYVLTHAAANEQVGVEVMALVYACGGDEGP